LSDQERTDVSVNAEQFRQVTTDKSIAVQIQKWSRQQVSKTGFDKAAAKAIVPIWRIELNYLVQFIKQRVTLAAS
jgi:hypothetical protein